MATGQTGPINSGQRMALFSRYNRRLSSRLLSGDGCAGPSCIALQRYTYRYAHHLAKGKEEDPYDNRAKVWRTRGCRRASKKKRGQTKDERREKERIIYYAVSMSLTMTASSILVTWRLSSQPISADHR